MNDYRQQDTRGWQTSDRSGVRDIRHVESFLSRSPMTLGLRPEK